MKQKAGNRLALLDLVRGLSAVVVCAAHLRSAIFVDYGVVAQSDVVTKIFYFSTSIGHQAVMAFFVLSGFFVGGSVLSRIDAFSWKSYLLARLTRLWVVLVPALLLTLVVDSVFAQYAPSVIHGQYQEMWSSGPNPDGTYSAGPLRFLSNLFFLQTVVTPVYGSNTPLWSLANEFWYYVLFPLAVTVCTKRNRINHRIAAVALIFFLIFWLPASIMDGMWIWLMGVVVWWLSRKNGLQNSYQCLLPLGVVMALASMVWVKLPQIQPPVGLAQDLAVGFGFAVLALPMVSLVMRGTFGNSLEWMGEKLSDISYSLYLSHFPLTLAFSVFVLRGRQLQPTLENYAVFFLVLAGIIGAGWIFWFLFERHTSAVRNWLGAQLVRVS